MIPVDPQKDKEIDEYFAKRKPTLTKMRPENTWLFERKTPPIYDVSKCTYKGIPIDQMTITELRDNFIELCYMHFPWLEDR